MPVERYFQAKNRYRDVARLTAALKIFDAQIVEKETEGKKLDATIVAQQALIATLKERVAMRIELVTTGAGSKANLLDGQESQQEQLTTLATRQRQSDEAKVGADVLVQER